MLQWHTNGGWAHRAYWGENVIDWGTDGTPERLKMDAPPASKQWVRLEVPVAKLKLWPGTLIEGWAFTHPGGTIYWDKAGIETEAPQDGQTYDSLTAWVRAQRAAPPAKAYPRTWKAIAPARAIASGPKPQTDELRTYFIGYGYAKTSGIFYPLRSKLEQAEQTRKQLDDQIATTLVYREKAGEPKPAFLLKRGEYDQRGEKVGRAVPAFLPPLPSGRRSTAWALPSG